MSDDPIEKQLSGIHLQRYREKCAKHPWYRESQQLIVEWNAGVKAKKDAGEDPKTLFDDPHALPVDEVIGFAKAVATTRMCGGISRIMSNDTNWTRRLNSRLIGWR